MSTSNDSHPNQPHTNRLIDETSPYLLQHAHNPVDWYPWCEEAFARARAEDKAVLLSVGYSACHWCHVMAHESFEDAATAELMNQLFVSVKVDREERPDVDDVYMSAVQLMTQHGGWPMTVFLTPDGQPFYGGTYFPPEDRHGMPSFRTLLRAIAEAYRDRRDELLTSSRAVVEQIQTMSLASARDPRSGNVGAASGVTSALLEAAVDAIGATFDRNNGGFGNAPKFPSTMALSLCLRGHRATGHVALLHIVTHSLERMRRGGIHDHLGGGFHRYSVDQRWLVPHFEKMLYDNAQLCRLYAEVWQVTGDDRARATALSIMSYIRREMAADGGGYYSTQDADSEGVEGKFYVWTEDEIKSVLGGAAEEFNRVYDVLARAEPAKPAFDLLLPKSSRDATTFGSSRTARGNFEGGASILNLLRCSDEQLAMAANLAPARELLRVAREQRIKPQRDDKILVAWNGLMLSAVAFAARVLESPEDLKLATDTAEFLWSELRPDGRLLHSYKDGVARHGAFLDDVAGLGVGYVELYQATFAGRWLSRACVLADCLLDEFEDREGGGFFYTGKDAERLFTRSKNPYDNAVPGGNSQAVHLLLRLYALTGSKRYLAAAERTLDTFSELMRRSPHGFAHMLEAVDTLLSGYTQVVVAGPPDSPATVALVDAARTGYDPNRVVVLVATAPSELAALVADKSLVDGRPAAYVCRGFTCQRPTTAPDELLRELRG